MRIGIFTNNYLPNPYGVSTSVDGFYRGLTALGHDVYIFAPHWKNDEGGEDGHIFRYPSVEVPTKVPFALALPYAPEIDQAIQNLDFDIIHAQHPNILGTQARRWAKIKGVPIVFTWHSLYDRYAHYVSLIPEKIASKWVMENAAHFADRADRVIFPTESVSEILKQKFVHDSISIVPSGVDENLFSNATPLKIREKYNIDADTPLLVTISRLSEEKNVLFLARSVRKFMRNHPRVVFLCCGDGDQRKAIQKMFDEEEMGERLIMPGQIKREEVKNYLGASDAFVYASTSETQGTIITEAMYCGVPIVAVRSSGVSDVVEDGVSGILTKEVMSDFTFALEKIVYDAQYRKILGAAAYKKAHSEYTVTACTQRLISVYEETIKEYKAKE